MSPLVFSFSDYVLLWLWVLFSAAPLFSLSSLSCFNIDIMSSSLTLIPLSNHLSMSCGCALIAFALVWPSLSIRSGSLCGHSSTVLAINNLYTHEHTHTTCACTHTHTCTHRPCATRSILCPGATPDFKLQLAEPEAKPNLQGSSVEVTQTGNNCLSHIFF